MNLKQLQSTLLLFFTLLVCSCSDRDDHIVKEDISSQWKLIEQYSDPGDGSGSYNPVNYEMILTFYKDGTIISSRSLCNLLGGGSGSYSGTYNSAELKIYPEGCEFPYPEDDWEYYLSYELKGEYLFLYYPCIEGCGQKFERIK